MCFRESDGLFLYQHAASARQGPAYRQAQTGISGSPMIEGDRLWFLTTRAEVLCLDIGPLHRREGVPRELWKLDLMDDELAVFPRTAVMGGGGLCSIAASYRDLIYVITGNGTDWSGNNVPSPRAPALLCLDKNTGKVIWEDSSSGANILFGEWGSPLVVEVEGRGQVIAPQGDGWLRSFDALTGELIWKFDINPKNAKWPQTRGFFSTAPVFYRNRIYIATGNYLEFGEAPGRLVCLDPTKKDDISLELDDGPGKGRPNPNSGAVWHFDAIGRTMATVAIDNGLLIAPDFSGIVHCVDADSGQTYWRHDLRAQCYTSPLIVEGKAYVCDGDGIVRIFELAKEKKLLAEHATGNSWTASSPIFANGALYFAAGDTLYAIGEKVSGSWPQWRGPDRSNVSIETGLLKEWPPEGPPLLWKFNGLGDGIASVAIQNGRLYTLGQRDGSEIVVALDAADGDPKWAARIGAAAQQNSLMRWLSPRTPTLDEDRMYALSTGGDLVCLRSSNGEVLWGKSYARDFAAPRPTWGFCDYPLVDGEKLICTPGGPEASVIALDKRTGQVIWKSVVSQGGHGSYAATLVIQSGKIRQYVTYLQKALVGLDATDGRVLWRYDKSVDFRANSYTPIVRGDYLFCANGYSGVIASIQLVPDFNNGVGLEEQYFRKTLLDPFQDCTAPVGDYVYTWQRATSPMCIDMRTGQIVWGAERGTGRGRAAVTYADGHLYFLRSDGNMVLVEATPKEYIEKGRLQIPEHKESSGASFPVVAAGRLYLRDGDRIFCYRITELARDKTVPAPRTIELTMAASHQEGAVAKSARLGKNRAPDAIFVPTPEDVVEKMLGLARIKRDDVVYALGSGDGRIVIAAAKKYGCQAVGYEIDPRLVNSSRENVLKNNLQALVRIEHEDIFTIDLSGADVVAVYLPSPLLQRLIPQFDKLKPGARIVSHQFALPGFKPDETVAVDSSEDGDKHRLFLWTLPLQKE
jgi:outer membrane protein assembly factor BamB